MVFSIICSKVCLTASFSEIKYHMSVVGHTMGDKVRATTGLQDIGVDAGMYVGGRGFLEISAHDGHFRGYSGTSESIWHAVDMTSQACGLSG